VSYRVGGGFRSEPHPVFSKEGMASQRTRSLLVPLIDRSVAMTNTSVDFVAVGESHVLSDDV
jgi:hypothetical protein